MQLESNSSDRRQDAALRDYVAKLDRLIDGASFGNLPKKEEVFDAIMNLLYKINEYRQVLICRYDAPKDEFIAIACHSSITTSNTSQIILPALVKSISTGKILVQSDQILINSLAGLFDHSEVGWEKPYEMDVFPLRFNGQLIGFVAADVSLIRHSKNMRLQRARVVLQRLVHYLASMVDPNLVKQALESTISDKSDIQIEAFINSPVPIILTNEYFRVSACNEAAEGFLNTKSDYVEEKQLTDIIPELWGIVKKLSLNVGFSESNINSVDIYVTGLSGESKQATVYFRKIIWGGESYWWVTLLDITELREIEQLNKTQKTKLKTISDVAPMGLLQTDRDWKVNYVNDMWCELTGMSKTELDDLKWLHFIPVNLINTFLSNLRSSLNSNTAFQFKVKTDATSSAGEKWLNIKAKSLPNKEGLIVCLEDVTAFELQNQKFLSMASTDGLTGLTNRDFFLDRLHQACLHASRGDGFALLSIDLDNFKWINDSLGHDVGDMALQKVAEHLTSHVRATDTVSRIGGDEFMVLMPTSNDPHQVAHIAESIIQNCKKIDNFKHEISLSVGIAIVDDGQTIDMNQLLKRADLALYSAKNAGKRQIYFYSTEMSTEIEQQLELTFQLRRALKRRELKVYYQLVWNEERSCFTGAEALLRWHQNEENIVGPDKFIELLEADGQIEDVTWFVMDEALAQLRAWIDLGALNIDDCHISVNFSGRMFRSQELEKAITGLLQKYSLPGHVLVIEITETSILDDEKLANKALKSLRESGVKIALDDFGTGYSPLTYLTNLLIDIIKIDKSFIQNLHLENHKYVVESVISLAAKLNLRIIAEGVEDQAMYDFLMAKACPLYQGFLFSRPSLPENCTPLLLNPQGQFDDKHK